ncbi:hypothetical protein SDRG_09403 [Saprolegnia diclina VS20]|uniref:PARP-type domain-containing protein n=1 Tax=Saprolegnia diclina (strain VS20) TaxID=1156394 RepID=T0QDQ6_SAPDV|nr:hypothetical protein SDRG_09403 [Saprolegnia diclina VS20]EQC32871.1 hypothetical protein SDRG_09403 [Saprolegnia diclina VS20]|eukprot:XP_008613557.1 hypothetical protein SDRG_09403 [Saprolegnia diclina VS20]
MTQNPWTLNTLPVIGTATTDGCLCQACKENISQGDIRVGLIFHHLNGYIALDWHHLTCCENPWHLPTLEGFDLLNDKEKTQVHAFIKQSKVGA